MRHGKKKKLTAQDMERALKWYDAPPTFGHQYNPTEQNYVQAPDATRPQETLFATEETVVDLYDYSLDTLQDEEQADDAGLSCEAAWVAVEGTAIEPALLDLYYKDDALGDPLLTEARVQLLGLVDEAQMCAIEGLARQINAVLVPFFAELGLQLVDFKLELGLNADGQLLLADEISPDTCRFWDVQTNDIEQRILDKDRFRKDLGGVIEAYGEVLKRIASACPKPRNCL